MKDDMGGHAYYDMWQGTLKAVCDDAKYFYDDIKNGGEGYHIKQMTHTFHKHELTTAKLLSSFHGSLDPALHPTRNKLRLMGIIK